MKEKIKNSIQKFNELSLFDATVKLLSVLGYDSPKTLKYNMNDYNDAFKIHQTANIDKAKVLTDWKTANFIFQITTDEVIKQHSLFSDVTKVNNVLIESYFVTAIELENNNYTRTELAEISRQVNKLHGLPTLIFFKYANNLTISVTYRRDNKKDRNKDVLGKVTLIKDIDISEPKRSQIEIIYDLSFNELKKNYTINNWVQLHDAWQKTLDTKSLNNRFYKEIANWYFWAINEVEFPKDAEKDKQNGKDTISVIRMLTRLVFCWFMKEKEELIPEKLFIKPEIEKILKDVSDTESTYYKAILQNLFFATLNTEIDKREFRSEKKGKRGSNPDYGKHYVYRYRSLFKNENEFENLFNNIPYLNGGIFDCLDIKGFGIPDKDLKYIDGFSERGAEYQPKVPNILFFGERKKDTYYGIDLSKVYETPKTKYELEGIVNILNSYKFTITENTPLEQEIALDPELLGKVFESLLAYYNPETGQNARKQQGSYYTPAEIVEYMVDESLKQYLKNCIENRPKSFVQLGSNQTNMFGNEGIRGQASFQIPTDNMFTNIKEVDTKIENLLSFSNTEEIYNLEEKKYLINSILNIKICDPACGSGAFPMGILNKLVFVLGKLDKDGEIIRHKLIGLKEEKQSKINENDKKLQILKQDIEHAKKIVSDKPREIAISELEKEIQELNNEVKTINKDIKNQPNFLRKLYLIKNCIYGVDIQSIAVTISKLRFFLSLLVDTTIHPNVPNKGIEPLPNLDYKLMQGNSLLESFEDIDLDISKVKDKDLFGNAKNSLKESDISELRDLIGKYFYTSDHTEKERINKTIRKIVTDFLHTIIELNISNIKLKIIENQATIKNYQKSLKNEKLEGNKKKFEKIIQQAEKDLKYFETELNRKKVQKTKIDEILHQNENTQFFLWHLFYKDVFDTGRFDIVIGNPPYVRQELLGMDLKNLLIDAHNEVGNGTADLYVYFYGLGLKLLKTDGILTYITLNKWMKTKYGRELRNYLKQFYVQKIIDFFELHVFTASTDTLITFIQNTKPQQTKYFPVKTLENLNLNVLTKGEYKELQKDESEWKTIDFQNETLLNKIYENTISLNEFVNEKIYSGVKTALNEAYIIDKKRFEILCKKDKKSVEVLKPYANPTSITKYGIKDEPKWFINTHNGILLSQTEYKKMVVKEKNIEFLKFNGNKIIISRKEEFGNKYRINRIIAERDFPAVYEYLLQFKENLIKRQDKGVHWSNLRNCDYIYEFENPKIIYIHTAKDHQFYYDTESYIINNSCYMIVTDKKFLYSLLNSKLFKWLKKIVFVAYGDAEDKGRAKLDYNKMVNIPIKNISEKQQEPFIRIVDYILFLKKQELKTPEERLLPAYFEQMIDVMVYELYFEELLKQHKHDILKYLSDLPDITEIKDNKKKFAVIQEQFNKFYDLKNPVRNSLYYIKNINEIAIIEGDKK